MMGMENSSTAEIYKNLCQELERSSLTTAFLFEERSQQAHEQTLSISKEDILTVGHILRHKLNFEFLMDITAVDWPEREKRFDVVYNFYNKNSNARLRIKTKVGAEETIHSLNSIWLGANWLEREVFDLFGIGFDNHPDMRRILCHHDFVGHPLRKDYPADGYQQCTTSLEHSFAHEEEKFLKKYDEDLMWINIGPAHPATHGTLRFMAVIDGAEIIREVDTEIGYLHRCFEKMCETHNYNQIIPYTDRLNYCSAPMNNSAFAATVEKLLNVKAPPRAQGIRMILDELSRIIDHLVCIGTNAVDLGALTNFWYFFHERENVYALFEKLCGARLTVSLTRIGGMGFDLPPGWISECHQVLDSIIKTHKEVSTLLTDNRIFVQRTRGAGSITKETAIKYGYTGPCLRATGIELDLRKSDPYYFYNEVDFDVPVGQNGDTYDRYLCRMEEIIQSVKIIKWILANLPEGPVMVPNTNIALPSKKDVYGNIEGLMNHFMLIINGIQPPVGEVYHSIEAANGELGFYIVSDGSGKPYRVKCRAPCFAILSGFPEMVRGGRIADAIAALGSINIIAGELDR